jgi:predicted hydrolase (HD superfamily)
MSDHQSYRDAIQKQLEPNIFKHSLALAACMAGIYEYLKTNNQLSASEPSLDDWTLAGLVHDIDYSGEWKAEHPQNTKAVLEKYGLTISPVVDQIVKSHAPSLTGVQPQSKAEWAIFCADSLTGLITAVAFVYPSKKLAEVKVSSVVKRFLKEPRFAAGTRRDEVALCARPDGLNMSLEKFIEVCLVAMQGIAGELDL